MRSVDWRNGDIAIIDQTLLPGREVLRRLRSTAQVAEAIASLRVRGAPAIGIAGGMGVAQAAVRSRARTARGVLRDAERAARVLARTRPTAVNLRWAIERVLTRAREQAAALPPDALAKAMVEEALAIRAEDERACLAMARHAQRFIRRSATLLTHCNTGFLCTGGIGTALGAVRLAHEQGRGVRLLHTETRPLLQGARLTAWECDRFGIPHALVTDAAAPGLIARGEVSAVLVGADRIAANGDTANKVGTYALALAAKDAGVPFVVVAPMSTVDLAVTAGRDIPIEEREPAEVLVAGRARIAPPRTAARNPAFDVTPARLITAIVTERGVARAPFRRTLRRLAGGPPSKG